LKDMQSKLRPAALVALNDRPAKPEEMFSGGNGFSSRNSRNWSSRLYQLDKDGKLSGEGETGDARPKAFLEGQLVKAGQMLGGHLVLGLATGPARYLSQEPTGPAQTFGRAEGSEKEIIPEA